MFYLITDQENKSWRNIQGGINTTHTENNPNYHFAVYDSPQTAAYMYPFYEKTESPKLWEVSGEITRSEGFRSKFSKLTSLKEFKITLPTKEQRITFGILCCMNLVMNPIFREWAIKYLKNEDQSPTTANEINEKLFSLLDCNWIASPENEYTYCAHTILTAVIINEPLILPAAAAHRAYYDSLEFSESLNLEQVAQIVNIMPANEIATLLK